MSKKVHIERIGSGDFAAIQDGRRRVHFPHPYASYAVGDIIRFREYKDPESGEVGPPLQRHAVYTGRAVEVKVTQVLSQGTEHVPSGITALSIQVLEDACETRIQAWHVRGAYPDSAEDYYETYVRMPHEWDASRVRDVLIKEAQEDGDTALGELLTETATFDRVAHTMVDGVLYIPAQTTNAIYH